MKSQKKVKIPLNKRLLIPFLCPNDGDPPECLPTCYQCKKQVATIVQIHDPDDDTYPCVDALCCECFVRVICNDPETDQWTLKDGLNAIIYNHQETNGNPMSHIDPDTIQGGQLWHQEQFPNMVRFVTAVPGGLFALLSDPREHGSSICTDSNGKWIYTPAELASHFILHDFVCTGQLFFENNI